MRRAVGGIGGIPVKMEGIMSEKRKGYITWDEYFMGVAKLSAMRSKDPSTQVGALSLIHI